MQKIRNKSGKNPRCPHEGTEEYCNGRHIISQIVFGTFLVLIFRSAIVFIYFLYKYMVLFVYMFVLLASLIFLTL
jgi:hypothetical protein